MRAIRTLLRPRAFVACLAVALLGCGRDVVPSTPGSGGTLVYARGKKSPGLDPAEETDGESALVITNVFDTLIAHAYGSASELVPALATKWTWGDDHRSLTLRLREGVKFHDGTPFDSAAVVANFERQRDPAHAYNFVHGAYANWQAMCGSVTKTVAVNPSEARMEFSEPAPAFFLHFLAMFAASIVSPGALAKGKEFVATTPVGTGAFRFVETRGDEIAFEANRDWWGGKPKIDRLAFVVKPDVGTLYLALQTGAVQGIDFIAPNDVAKVKANPNTRLHQTPGMNVCYLTMNNDVAPFTDARVRRAIGLAIDRAKLIDAAYLGQAVPATTLLPSTVDGHVEVVEGTREADPAGAAAKAKALLAEAGASGAKLRLSYPSNPRPYMPDPNTLAIQVAEDLKAIGLSVELKKEEWGPYLDMLSNGEHQMGLIGWSADIADADNFLYVLLDKDGAVKGPGNSNNSFWKSDEFHEKVLAARRTYDAAERDRLYADAQRIAAREVPIVPLVHTPATVATSARVGNFLLDPVNSRRFAWVTLEP
jgi:ABC-type transport system substrate-binding protein